MIERAPSDASLSFLAASPLEDLLSKDGPDFIGRVEERARENAKFRRAVGMLRRLGMTDDVWKRVQWVALSKDARPMTEAEVTQSAEVVRNSWAWLCHPEDHFPQSLMALLVAMDAFPALRMLFPFLSVSRLCFRL